MSSCNHLICDEDVFRNINKFTFEGMTPSWSNFDVFRISTEYHQFTEGKISLVEINDELHFMVKVANSVAPSSLSIYGTLKSSNTSIEKMAYWAFKVLKRIRLYTLLEVKLQIFFWFLMRSSKNTRFQNALSRIASKRYEI